MGVEMRHLSWRKINGDRIAGVRKSNMQNPDRYAILPINLLSRLLKEELDQWPSATIKWKHRITAAGQDEDKAWVDVDTPEGAKRLTADYLIGCDGANSVVRQSLHGRNFPGHTWDGQLVATNVMRISGSLGVLQLTFDRYITILISMDGMTPNSLCIQNITASSRESQRTGCGACPTPSVVT